LAKITKTAFRDVKFKTCKLLGLHFDNCNEFLLLFDFEDCNLDLSSFYKLSLKNQSFKNCSLQEVDFTESDLSNSSFDNCDLTSAIFENTILEKTDFRSSYGFSIDPDHNKIRKAKFSVMGLAGLLDKYDIDIE
jgi:uncharacterized protein YjbI with pentapeptide repeats